MTSKILRHSGVENLVGAGLVGTGAGLLGVLAVGNPSAALIAIVAAMFGAVTLWRPFVGVLFLVAAIPLENMFVVAEGVTALRAAGAAVFVLWLVRKVANGETWRHLLENGFVYAAAAFVILAFLSVIWATNVRVAQRGGFQLAMLFAWSLLLLDLIRSWHRVDLLARVLVAAGLVAGTLTVVEAMSGARRAGQQLAGGVNATAVIIVSLIPIAFYLLRASESRFWRLLGAIYVGLGSIAVTTTYSRMNLLLLPPLLLVLFWMALRDGRHRGWLLLLLVGGAVGIVAIVPVDRLLQRAETIVPYLKDSAGTGEAEPVEYSGRGYHLRVGLEIFKDHPILGVGYNNYGELFKSEYQYRIGGVTRIYTSHRSPHSSHMGVLADLGSVGFLVWLGLLAVAVWRVCRAKALCRHARTTPYFIFTQCIFVLLLLYVLAYGWYFPTQKDKLFWLILSLAAVSPVLVSRSVSYKSG